MTRELVLNKLRLELVIIELLFLEWKVYQYILNCRREFFTVQSLVTPGSYI